MSSPGMMRQTWLLSKPPSDQSSKTGSCGVSVNVCLAAHDPNVEDHITELALPSPVVPVGYGVRKMQISLVVEDEKVSLDELQETIAEFEDFVQSSDIQAMQKL